MHIADKTRVVHSAHMKPFGITGVITALLVPAFHARAEVPQPVPTIGDEYEISWSSESSSQTSDGSSSQSHNRDTVLERVIGGREFGLELEYDLPKDAKAEDRARIWQFPVRVLRPSNGPMQLLNRHELELRLESWLKAAGWTRDVCGRWFFTWNAFRIDCDPQSVIKAIEALDFRSANLREGALYQVADARGPGTLTKETTEPNATRFAVVMEIDPATIHRTRAESDVAIGEIMQKAVTLDAATRERKKESVSGTISVTFDIDSAGNVRRRTKITKLEIKRPDGVSESKIVTETVERHLSSSADQ